MGDVGHRGVELGFTDPRRQTSVHSSSLFHWGESATSRTNNIMEYRVRDAVADECRFKSHRCLVMVTKRSQGLRMQAQYQIQHPFS